VTGAHTCALTTTGAAYCWGYNANGQLGNNGTGTITATPVRTVGDIVFESLSVSKVDDVSCGLSTSGAAYCWGKNDKGQLGDGTTTRRLVPTPVAGGLRFKSLAVGTGHACAVAMSGAAYCWGSSPNGAFGDGSTGTRLTPMISAPGLTFESIVAGGDYTCALTTVGAAYCWGVGALGQLGDGAVEMRTTPVAVEGGLAFRALAGDSIPRLGDAHLDPMVLGFAALTTFATGIAFGLTPVVRFGRVHSGGALREQARSVTSSGGQGRLRSGLAAAQLALALTLLTGAGVLIASFVRLQGVPLGFRVDRVLTFDVSLPAARYDAARRAIVQEQLASAIASIPGVIAAGGTSRLPATGSYHAWSTRIDSGPLAGTQSTVLPQQRVVSGRFFEALAIPVLAGRAFDARDDVNAPRRAVVSADFARVAFPGLPLAEVVGQRITAAGEAREIVGVVGDVKLDVRGTSAPVVYHAHRQFAADRNWALTHVVASERQPDQLLGAVRAAVAALDPQLVVYRAAPMTEVTGRGVRRERFALVLMGTFAAIALGLAALGLYGVLAYTVRQRTREIGIRMALGATLVHVRALVLRQAVQVLAMGAIAGLAGALLLGRWMSSLTFDINPWDGRVLLTTTLLLGIVGLLAAWLPTRRATSVDPKIAMLED